MNTVQDLTTVITTLQNKMVTLISANTAVASQVDTLIAQVQEYTRQTAATAQQLGG